MKCSEGITKKGRGRFFPFWLLALWFFAGALIMGAAISQGHNPNLPSAHYGLTQVIRGQPIRRAVVNFAQLAEEEKLFPPLIQPKAVHPPMPIPFNLPIPFGGSFGKGTFLVSPLGDNPSFPPPFSSPPSSPPNSSPPPSVSFLALEDDNTRIPPDTHGAVGLNHLMVTLNSQVRIQDRTGANLGTVSLQSFWSSVGPFSGVGVFDPKSLYDPYSNRWIFTACASPRASDSSVLIGVSQTSDPTGNWNLYRVDADANNQVWVDYPSIGFNKDWIVVQVNVYNISDNAFNRSHIYVFDKADLYAGGSGTFTLFQSSGIGGTQVPAVTYDNTLDTLYLLQVWNPNFGGKGWLRLYKITGAVGSEQFTAVTFVEIPSPWDYLPNVGWNDFAPQLGSTRKIMNNDSRMQNLVYRNGSLWATHTAFLPANSGTRSSVQWYQIAPDGTVQQFGRIDDPSGTYFFAFPSIAVNKFNDVLIGYSSFSASQYASADYSFRFGIDPPNTFRDPFIFKDGEAPYYKTFGAGKNRWGDYSHTIVDPLNDTDLWTIQEYAATPSDRWGTWWAKVVPPNLPPITTLSPKNASSTAGTLQTFTATYEDHNGYQDIRYAAIRISNSALAAAYVPTTNRLYLLDDAGNRWLGGYPPGSPNAIRNRQGLLDCQNTTVSTSDSALTIHWSFVPDGNWARTTQRVYLFAEDKPGGRAGWEQKGTWTILENQGNFKGGRQTFPPKAPHDLAVINLSVIPSDPKVMTDMTVRVTVANLGRNSERNLRFRLSVNGHIWFVEQIEYIGSGLTLEGTYTLKAYPPPGVYKLQAEISPIPLESDRANNFFSRTVIVRR
jgi:hypothetical protein